MTAHSEKHLSFALGIARRRGMTLLEMVVSVGIMSILATVIGSTIIIASRALPEEHGPADNAIRAAAAADQLATEIQYAISITVRSSDMVEFTVADRDGDEVPETIRYIWSGTAGGSLRRQYNGGTSREILTNVHEFNLSYDLQAISEETPDNNESAQTQLITNTYADDQADRTIKDNEWYGQYFLPSLPVDAVSWKVTWVGFYAKNAGSEDGEVMVQLHLPTTGNWPSGVVLEEKVLKENTLTGTYTWREFSFANVSDLSPQQGLCLVIKHVTGSEACKILIQDKDFSSSRTNLIKTTNAGASWTAPSEESMLFCVYGTVTNAGEPDIQNTYYIRGVRIKLSVGDGAGESVSTGVRILNAPEVTE